MRWDKDAFFENLRDFVQEAAHVIPAFWNYEMFQVDKSPITVGNVVFGLVFIILGYILIRLAVRSFERRVLTRLDINVPQRYTIKVFLFYFLIILLFLFTLHLIKIPLTVFAVIGTAVAVGVGFGAKNILNNFISGIVIVIEHPVRVGDLIEVDNLVGVVEHIGFRSTHIRSLDNTNFIIPNSKVLEENVLNWTLSDKVVRCEVKAGVAYGSPTEKVRDLLLRAAEEHPKVFSRPPSQKPRVFFSSFGDNALEFTLTFWIAVEKPLDIRQTSSDIRFRVNELFNEGKVVIAFPQRDIHITEPVSVHARVFPSSQEKAGGASGKAGSAGGE